jgi:hypothetical protein
MRLAINVALSLGMLALCTWLGHRPEEVSTGS